MSDVTRAAVQIGISFLVFALFLLVVFSFFLDVYRTTLQ
jgi:hypothetical protein